MFIWLLQYIFSQCIAMSNYLYWISRKRGKKVTRGCERKHEKWVIVASVTPCIAATYTFHWMQSMESINPDYIHTRQNQTFKLYAICRWLHGVCVFKLTTTTSLRIEPINFLWTTFVVRSLFRVI